MTKKQYIQPALTTEVLPAVHVLLVSDPSSRIGGILTGGDDYGDPNGAF